MPTVSTEHLVAAYWLDRVLPGVLVAVIAAPILMWIQHRTLSRKVASLLRRELTELRRHFDGGKGGAG